MKLIIKLFLVFSFISLINSCDLASTDPTIPGLKGYLYYFEDENRNIRRYNFQSEISDVVIQNARYPDVTTQGDIIAVSPAPFMLFKTNITNFQIDTILKFNNFNDTIYKRDILYPRISYNQKYIAYLGEGYEFSSKIYIINYLNGSLVASIGDESNNKDFAQPSWAPDGSIYLTRWPAYETYGIYKISSDFQTITLIDSTFDNIKDISVSPDGKYLAFISHWNLWIMGVDGTNPRLIHKGTLSFSLPTWSPDSKYIVAKSLEEDGYAYVFDLSNNSFMPLKKLGRLDFRNQLTWVY